MDKDADGSYAKKLNDYKSCKPVGSWNSTSNNGIDCDDDRKCVTTSCTKVDWYLDNDGDFWYAEKKNDYKSCNPDSSFKWNTKSNKGIDCNDNIFDAFNFDKSCVVTNNDCKHILDGSDLTGTALVEIVGWREKKKGTTKAQIEEIAKFINKYATSYGVNSPEQRFHFYTQIAAETGGLTELGELRSKEKSSMLFYKGEGIIQLTGSRNFQAFQDYLTANKYNYDIMTHPELLAENMELAVLSALWYWDKGNNVKKYATDYSDNALLNVSKQVNCGSVSSNCGGNEGGYPNGWRHRKKNAKRIKDCIN